jgi:hypothetical protein
MTEKYEDRVHTGNINKSFSVTLPPEVVEKYGMGRHNEIVFVEAGNYLLLVPKDVYEMRLDHLISGKLPLTKIDKQEGKRIALETVKYLTQINNEHTVFDSLHVAAVLDVWGPIVISPSDFDTLELYLKELANEGLLNKSEMGLSDGKPSYVYRAKL